MRFSIYITKCPATKCLIREYSLNITSLSLACDVKPNHKNDPNPRISLASSSSQTHPTPLSGSKITLKISCTHNILFNDNECTG